MCLEVNNHPHPDNDHRDEAATHLTLILLGGSLKAAGFGDGANRFTG